MRATSSLLTLRFFTACVTDTTSSPLKLHSIPFFKHNVKINCNESSTTFSWSLLSASRYRCPLGWCRCREHCPLVQHDQSYPVGCHPWGSALESRVMFCLMFWHRKVNSCVDSGWAGCVSLNLIRLFGFRLMLLSEKSWGTGRWKRVGMRMLNSDSTDQFCV